MSNFHQTLQSFVFQHQHQQRQLVLLPLQQQQQLLRTCELRIIAV